MHHSVQIGLARALRALAVAALPVACILPNPGFIAGSEGEASATASTSEVTTEADTDTDAETATTTTGMLTTGMATTGMFTTGLTTGALTTEDPTTSSTSETTTDSDSETSGQVDLPASCAEVLEERGPASGLYVLADPGDPEVAITVYCDLEIAGGGWLLAGRSHPTGGKGTFGWRSTAGSVDDDGGIYSLNLLEHPFPFTEVLIGDYSAGKTWGAHVYRIGVPEDLVTAYPELTDHILTEFHEVERGDCTPSPGWMFKYAGYTSVASAFYFRDNPPTGDAEYGLLHNQIWTYYDDCVLGGSFNTRQGMIMVR